MPVSLLCLNEGLAGGDHLSMVAATIYLCVPEHIALRKLLSTADQLRNTVSAQHQEAA
jgi:hypothetical protein